MAKIRYEHSDPEEIREAQNIEFTVPDDLNIFEYRIMCMRLASALGYTSESIKKAFGEESDPEADINIDWLNDWVNNIN